MHDLPSTDSPTHQAPPLDGGVQVLVRDCQPPRPHSGGQGGDQSVNILQSPLITEKQISSHSTQRADATLFYSLIIK